MVFLKKVFGKVEMQTVVVICVMLHVKLGYQGRRCSWEVSWRICVEGSGARVFALQNLLFF